MKKHAMNRLVWLMLRMTPLGAMCGGLAGQDAPEAVSFNGTILAEGIAPDGSVKTNYHYQIAGHRTREKFLFQSVDGSDKSKWECGWNGEALHSIKAWGEAPGLPRTNVVAYLEPGVAPRYGPSAVQLTALTLAPEGKLWGLVSNSPPLNLSWGTPIPEDFNTFELKNAPESGRLVSIKAFAPGFMAFKGKRYDNPPPYDQGFLRWHFEVLEHQNGIPSKTRLLRYSHKDLDDPQPPTHREDVELISRSLLSLDCTPSAPPSDFRPAIPQDPLYVRDYRYTAELDLNRELNPEEIGGILLHKLKDKQWKYDTNRAARAIVDLKKGVEARSRFVNTKLGRTLTLLLSVIVILAPLAMLHRRRRKNQTASLENDKTERR